VTLKGNVVARTLDDAVWFMRDYEQARRPTMRDGVLHRLEGAQNKTAQCDTKAIQR